MRVAIIGASGRTGRLAAARLREHGHTTVGVVRSAARAEDVALDEVREADARDAEALEQALRDTNAVLYAVGPVKGESAAIMQDTIGPVLAAMAAVGVRRLIAVTATGWVIDGDDPLSRFVAKPLLGLVLRETNAAFGVTEAMIRASDRDWTIVRPPRLTDAPARGRYRRRRDGNVRWGYDIRRGDLATALVDVLEDPTSVQQVVAVAA